MPDSKRSSDAKGDEGRGAHGLPNAGSLTSTRSLPSDHPAIPPERIGVLLVNLGTPDGTDYWSMRRYLKEFLSDRRVIELSPLLWQPILQGVILTVRPRKSGEAYAAIWNREKDESPLRSLTRAMSEKLAAHLGRELPQVLIDWGMRYGSPSTASRVAALTAAGCSRLLVFPLYPQYSAATTGTACDAAFRALMKERWQPSVRTLPAYFDDPGYIEALATSVQRRFAELDWQPEVLLASFHGLPRENLDKGDPYHCQCQKTARLLRERLGWPAERLRIVFQSRFGPKEWLQPYADATVMELAEQGVKDLAVISPGFAADCVETLEELDMELRETFSSAGGRNFAYVPCLNDGEAHIALLADLVRRELAGWI